MARLPFERLDRDSGLGRQRLQAVPQRLREPDLVRDADEVDRGARRHVVDDLRGGRPVAGRLERAAAEVLPDQASAGGEVPAALRGPPGREAHVDHGDRRTGPGPAIALPDGGEARRDPFAQRDRLVFEGRTELDEPRAERERGDRLRPEQMDRHRAVDVLHPMRAGVLEGQRHAAIRQLDRGVQLLGELPGAEYHLIGHLQSNKARVAAGLFHAIETVDSEKLARRLDAMGQSLEVMIEVKLSHEESKAGAAPEELSSLIPAIRSCPNLRLTGLMTMPPWCDDPEVTRPYFRRLAELAREHGLPKLSMGMSHDLEAAIEEGSTHVRVGTALFGPRPKPIA